MRLVQKTLHNYGEPKQKKPIEPSKGRTYPMNSKLSASSKKTLHNYVKRHKKI